MVLSSVAKIKVDRHKQFVQKLLAISFAMMLILAGCKGVKKPSPQKLDQASVKQDAAGTTVVAAIGDSITWGALAFGARASSEGYPAILQTKLRTVGYDVVVLNKGIPGDKSFETDDRFLSASDGAEIALLMIGTNDIIRPEGCPEPHNCRTAEHIAAMMEKALAANLVPFVSTVTPAQPGCNRAWANPPIQVLNTQIYEVAHKRNVKIVDNYQAIMNNGSGALFADCLHFTDKGYEVIAQQWYNALVESELLKKVQK